MEGGSAEEEGSPAVGPSSQAPSMNPQSATHAERGIKSTYTTSPNPSRIAKSNAHGNEAGHGDSDPDTRDHSLSRTVSAPSSLENASDRILSEEEKQEATRRAPPEGASRPPAGTESRLKGTTHLGIGDLSPSRKPQNVMESLDDIVNSPKAQNDIAERSPEGRYIRFMEKLGSGASKDVYRAYDTTEGIEVAWNVVSLAGVPKTDRGRIVSEVRLLERLHHQNIISFHGSWVNRERQEVNFVTEILSSGTLKSFIDKVQVIRWKIAKRWAVQILKGLQYLHDQDPPVIHRDLKCENIFINGASGDLRIGDLGLSTVQTNGKALSILGTPEFMAPDMYEETAYDEKVDIYSFGMCLLEIFTKEVPYRECNNPAQIYKKVIHGELPESLRRLKSQAARDFIMLCLGHKDESGKYIRPGATELLQNSFLEKGPNDDSEVEVYLPMQETVIVENPPRTSARNIPDREDKKPGVSISHTQPTSSGGEQSQASSRRPSLRQAEDDPDGFIDMPDSEVNIKKVKVLMGRGQELQDDDTQLEAPSQKPPAQSFVSKNDTGSSGTSDEQSPGQSPGNESSEIDQPQVVQNQKTQTTQEQYLVAAAVIEDESPLIRPYEDDILKLIVTLPVDGQPRNVQFDFHLVEDDPVQVAREMVTELSIPQEAVLEISGTISALSRQARMKQDKYNNRFKRLAEANAQNHPQKPPATQITEQQVKSNQVVSEQHAPPVSGTILQSQSTGGQIHNAQHPDHSSHQPVHPNIQVHPPQASVQPAAPAGESRTVPETAQDRKIPNVQQPQHGVPSKVESSDGPLPRPVVQTPTAQPQVQIGQPSREQAPSSLLGGDKSVINEEEEEDDEEVKKVDEDFQKNMMRAQKVFDNRMENLKRSKQEKEAQHQKTLEKHEKERQEFEKRVEHETNEQNRRLEQIRREWVRKRELVKNRSTHEGSYSNLTEQSPPQESPGSAR